MILKVGLFAGNAFFFPDFFCMLHFSNFLLIMVFFCRFKTQWGFPDPGYCPETVLPNFGYLEITKSDTFY